MNWIKIEDKLPNYEKGDIIGVIVSGFEDGKRYVHYADLYIYGKDNEVFSIPGWSKMNVTHWQPFPEPPIKN